jgi:hypothetical protein
MHTPVFALLITMACVSLSTAFNNNANLAYQLRNFNAKPVSIVANTAFRGHGGLSRLGARPKRQGAAPMNMIGTDFSINHNTVIIKFLGLVSFALLSGETMAQAFVPDLSGSPLKNAPPTIIVEGVPRIVDGMVHSKLFSQVYRRWSLSSC